MTAHARSQRAWRGLTVLCLAAALLAVTGCGGGQTVRSERQAIARTVDLAATQRDADAAYAQGRFEEAVSGYHTLVQAIPDNAEFWYRMANAHARLGNTRQAATAYEQSVARDPTNARAWHNLGLMLHRQSMDAFGRGVARAQGGDTQAGQESLRVLRILREADSAIRDEPPPVQVPAPEDAAGESEDDDAVPH